MGRSIPHEKGDGQCDGQEDFRRDLSEVWSTQGNRVGQWVRLRCPVLMAARRGHQIPLELELQLSVALRVLGVEPPRRVMMVWDPEPPEPRLQYSAEDLAIISEDPNNALLRKENSGFAPSG